ncbi:MAG: ATP-binding protein [Bacteroidaceae bacterium]|nr:ATP-binding protein [Bacteroidaceae bacterium]
MRRLLTFILCLSLVTSHLVARNVGKPFFRNYSALEYKGHNRNFTILSDGSGRVFVANFEGLVTYDGAVWSMTHTPGISRITSLYLTSENILWIGGDDVLGYMNPDDPEGVVYVASDTDESVSFGEISRIFEHGGKIYFVNGNDDAYCVDDGRIGPCSPDADFIIENTTFGWQIAGINDREDITDLGLTALATSNRGVLILDSGSRELYSLTVGDGLCSNNVNSLTYDGKGSLWGATDNGLFVVQLSPVYTHYSENDGLSGQVTSILHNNGSLYVGTLQGMYMLNDGDRFDRISDVELACWQLARAYNGEYVLAATADGVYRIDNEITRLTSRHTLCVIMGDDSSFLTGELNGIYYHTVNGDDRMVASIPNVAKFESDADGGVWAITLGKEVYYMASGAESFERRENGNISLLFQYTDRNGSLWHSDADNTGLRNDDMSPQERPWWEPFSTYNIQAMEINEDIAWIGGNFGLIRVNRAQAASRNVYEPVLYLRGFQLNDDYVGVSIASDKSDPIGNTMYSYRLDDGAEWSRWSANQEYNFSHLSSGTYSLTGRVKDAYGNIVESETIKFVIPTPLFLRWYAIVVYVLLLFLIAYAIFRLRIRQAQEEQLRLERIVNERTKELKDAQNQLLRQEREATVGKLTSGLIDRILNPLNYINNFSHLTIGLAKDIKDNLEDDEEKMTEDVFEDCMDVLSMMDTNLSKIEQHGLSTTRILKAMEELLQERAVKAEKIDLKAFCQQNMEVFRNYFATDISEKNIQVEFDVPDGEIEAMVTPTQFSKVVNSMLANSIYAVKKKFEKNVPGYVPLIRLSIRRGTGNSGPSMSVYDNGIGIEENIKDKLFDPFFTTKPTAEAAGIGLYLSQQIIQDAGGSISFSSEKDEFTEFTVNLPVVE